MLCSFFSLESSCCVCSCIPVCCLEFKTQVSAQCARSKHGDSPNGSEARLRMAGDLGLIGRFHHPALHAACRLALSESRRLPCACNNRFLLPLAVRSFFSLPITSDSICRHLALVGQIGYEGALCGLLVRSHCAGARAPHLCQD